MSLLQSAATLLSTVNAAIEKRVMSLAELDGLMDRVIYGLPTSSGQYVNVDTALQTVAVWACVQAISETISSLPFVLYRELPGGGKERFDDHRLFGLIHDAPNPEMTAREFWETALTHRLTWGNFYAHIVLDDYGAKELWPLDPSKMSMKRDGVDGPLYYVYKKNVRETEVFAFRDIFHVRGRSLDGIVGLSPIAYQRQTIGLAAATSEFGARWFGNGARPSGILAVQGKLSPEAAKRLKAGWEQAHAGTSNAHRVAVLEEGVTWTPTTVPPEDSQFLQTIKATKEDIASIFRVPPHKIGLLEHTNRASIEEQNIEWVIDTVLPECVRIEQVVQRDLINIGKGKRGVFAQFDVDGLLRGNQAQRYAAYAQGIQWGFLCADEIRNRENLNPIPNGDGKTFLRPLNMVPVGQEPVALAPDNTEPGDTGTPPDDNPPADVIQTKGKSYFRDIVPLLTASNGANGRH